MRIEVHLKDGRVALDVDDDEARALVMPLVPTVVEHAARVEPQIGVRRAADIVADELRRRGVSVQVVPLNGGGFVVEEDRS